MRVLASVGRMISKNNSLLKVLVAPWIERTCSDESKSKEIHKRVKSFGRADN